MHALSCVLTLALLTTIARAQDDPVPAGFESIHAELEIGTLTNRMSYDTAVLEAAPGARVKLTLNNTDTMQHNWLLCRPGNDTGIKVAKLAWALGAEAIARDYVPESDDILAASKIINPGERGTVYFTAPESKGVYPYVCTLPGHAMTMRGILYVGIDPPPDKATTVAPADFPASGVERARKLKKSYLRHQKSGRLFSGTLFFQEPHLPPVHKGIALQLGDHGEGAVVFDSDLLSLRAGWLGPFIQTTDREDEATENRHKLGSNAVFVNSNTPGWSYHQDDSLADPRARNLGPLPDNWARYRGLYSSGERAVLHYTVGNRKVLESPWLETVHSHQVFTRSFEIAPSQQASRLVVCSAPHAYDLVKRNVEGVSIFKMGNYSKEGLAVAMAGRSNALTMRFADLSRLEVLIPASERAIKFKIFLTKLHHRDLKTFGKVVNNATLDDLSNWTAGGSEHWPDTIITQGELAAADNEAPYVVDTLTLPYNNPWNALMYASGHDFFANGDAAVCMSHGDVWIVRGINDNLKNLRWKRFAAGLSSPLGLKIVDDVIHVTCHDQITRLHDLNDNGEADYYECFNNDCQVTKSHHRFATNLDTDPAGNFYYTKCTEEGNSDHGGSILRVSRDGNRLDVVATGLRNPNGMAISPTGLITYGKQQGGWIPSSGIQLVREGEFYGYMPAHHRSTKPNTYSQPLCWIPHGIDNSSGGQAWVPTKNPRWGPLTGSMLHFSYGQCRMFVVPYQQVGEAYQGAVVPLPGVTFQSSAMRARFRSTDGQLYVSGLRGWQTSAQLAGALHRVRYTGNPLYLTTGFEVESEGLRLRFSQPINRNIASDVSRYEMQQWNYRWTESYGSKDYQVSDPSKQGRDVVIITAAEVSDDGSSVLLRVPTLQPAMQLSVSAMLEAMDGQALPVELYGTINVIP